jgi:hypothetical protein
MKKNVFKKGTLIFVYAFLSFFLAGMTLGTAQAQVTQVASHPCLISNIAAVEVDRTDITVENRIYVQCANSTAAGLSSFASAIGTTATTATTAANANRYLVMLNTAVALGKTVTVYYDVNFAHNPLGCQADCRKITGLVLGP